MFKVFLKLWPRFGEDRPVSGQQGRQPRQGEKSAQRGEVITQMLAGGEGRSWEEKLRVFMVRAQGAYCLTMLTRDAIFAVRDPWGLHPLCLGRIGEKGWVAASESRESV